MAVMDSKDATLYSMNTHLKGTPPCSLQMENSGTLNVVDSRNVTLAANGALPSIAAGSGTLAAGQTVTSG